MIRPRRTRAAAVGVAALLAVVLGGCGGLPTESAVQPGSRVGEPAPPPVRVQPDGPSRGASPVEVVEGFLRAGAGAGFDDDHAVARSFLTPNVKDVWLPDSGVQVYGDEPAVKVELIDPVTVSVTASIVASVDSVGRYSQRPAGALTSVTFGVQKLDVGWRISAPQKGLGLWLGASDLDRLYRPFTIAYVSKTTRTIVGDRRWFPITPGLATRLARAQLAPVPGYLAGAVLSGVPAGTVLGVDAVPIASGAAVVELSSSALSADPEQRRAMWAQFVTTLTQVPSVSEVSLQVDGAGLDLPGTPERVSTLSLLGYRSAPSVVAGSAVLRVGADLRAVPADRPLEQDHSDRAISPPARPLPSKISTRWAALALSSNGAEIAAISGERTLLARWQGNRFFSLTPFATKLTKPSYDTANGLWIGGEGTGGKATVWVIDASLSPIQKAKPRAILAPLLTNRRVLAVRVANDNVRLALITSDRAGGDQQVVVTGIVRSANGASMSLAPEWQRVGSSMTAASDLSWVDANTLAVVGRVSARAPIGPQLLEIGGKVTALPPVAGARLVTNTGGSRGVVVVTDAGKVLARAGNGWRELQRGNDFLIAGQ